MKKIWTHVRDMNDRDPFILKSNEQQLYFYYSSRPVPGQEKRAFYIRESKDLVWWSDPICVYEPDDQFWGPLDFWAPECHVWQNHYYLISSFRSKGGFRGCAALVADSPYGPFKPVKNKPATPANWHCLDGTLYVDKNDLPWMVFCHEWPQVQDGQIAAVRLSDDLGEAISDPVILIRGSEAPWKFTDPHLPWLCSQPQPIIGWARVTDGPFLYRCPDETLLMLWSSFSDTGYTVGCARSQSGELEGPWLQEPEPLFSQDGGHGMLFRDFDNRLIMALHAPNIHKKEHLLLFHMDDQNGRLQIINELTGNWLPSRYFDNGSGKGQDYISQDVLLTPDEPLFKKKESED